MKIISKFKDYYDIIGQTYGVDNKIAFDRTIEIPSVVKVYVPDEFLIRLPDIQSSLAKHSVQDSYHTFYEMCRAENIQRLMLLSMCGRPIFIGQTESSWRPNADGLRNEYVGGTTVLPSEELVECMVGLSLYMGLPNLNDVRRYLMRVSQKIRSPIFILKDMAGRSFNHYSTTRNLNQDEYEFYLGESVPRLADIKGFAKKYSSDQIYQDISYWVANVMNGSPDLMPEPNPELTDVERVLSHGFDKRVSFRHRKE